MIPRPTYLLLLLALLLVGCSLSRAQDATETSLPTQDPGALLTQTLAAQLTATLAPTRTPDPTATPGQANNTSSNPVPTACVTRADWPVYVIIAGDTLSAIARRTNSTVAQLASANCIADPSLIEIGQQIRVPALPASQPQFAGSVTVSPYVTADGGLFALQASSRVTLRWENVSLAGLAQVDFELVQANGTVTVLGVDTNLADGASITWTATPNAGGDLFAAGRAAGAASPSLRSLPTAIAVGPVQTDNGAVFVAPYTQSGTDQFTVQEGQSVTFYWPNAPLNDALRVDFYMQIASAGSPNPTLLGTDTYMADGASIVVQMTARSAGPVTAVAYLRGGAQVTTARPVTIFVTPAGESTPVTGSVGISPVTGSDLGRVILETGRVVTLTWLQAPSDVTSVEFFYYPSGSAAPVSVGVDNNVTDGVSVQWTVPASISGQLFAGGRLPGQTHQGRISAGASFVTATSNTGRITTTAAYQAFENGFMLWRQDRNDIYVLFNNGQYTVYSGQTVAGYPDNPIPDNPPSGRVKPVRGFGRVWGSVAAVRSALGWGLADEQGYTMEIEPILNVSGVYDIAVSWPDGRHIVIRTNGTWGYEP